MSKNPAQQQLADSITEAMRNAIRAIEDSPEFTPAHVGIIAKELQHRIDLHLESIFGVDCLSWSGVAEAGEQEFSHGQCGAYDEDFAGFADSLCQGRTKPAVAA